MISRRLYKLLSDEILLALLSLKINFVYIRHDHSYCLMQSEHLIYNGTHPGDIPPGIC